MSSALIVTIIASIFIFSIFINRLMKNQLRSKQNYLGNIESKVDSVGNSSVNETNVKPKKRRVVLIVAFSLIMIAPVFFFTKGCSSDYKNVTFAIEENGKKYIYSSSEFMVLNAIRKNEVPPMLNLNTIYFIDNEIHMRPSDIEQMVQILSKNYKLIEKREPSYNGYAVKDSLNVFETRVKNKAGKKIGETEMIQLVTISKLPPSKQTMEIKWKTQPTLEAIANCSIEDVWVVTNPYPGKTIGNWEEDILVKLSTINKFFDNSFELLYDDESAVLYLKKIR